MGKTFSRRNSEKEDLMVLRSVERRLKISVDRLGGGALETHHARKALAAMKRKTEWVDA